MRRNGVSSAYHPSLGISGAFRLRPYWSWRLQHCACALYSRWPADCNAFQFSGWGDHDPRLYGNPYRASADRVRCGGDEPANRIRWARGHDGRDHPLLLVGPPQPTQVIGQMTSGSHPTCPSWSQIVTVKNTAIRLS